MRNIKRIVLNICLLGVIAFLSQSVVFAQEVSFDITEADMIGEVKADGSVTFQEVYTYDVDYMNGSYHIVDYGNSKLTDYRVGIIDKESGEIEYLSESMNGLPSTFQTSDDGNNFRFKVFYPVQNKKVDFVFEYTLENLITNYYDTAELNRKLVGENTDDSFLFNAKIYLPRPVENVNDFRAWGHGPYNGVVYPKTENNKSFIEVHVPKNPANQFIEVRALFPTSLTPNNSNTVPEAAMDRIIQQEEEQVAQDKAEHEDYKQNMWLLAIGLLILFPFLSIISLVYYVRNRQKLNPKPAHVPEHVYSLPEDITPAIMATSVFRNTPTADDFSATIVDLSRKGYLELKEVEKEKRGLLSRKTSSTVEVSPAINPPDFNNLQKHERYVYDYVLPDNQPTILSNLEELTEKNSSFRKQQNRKWTQFVNFTQVMGEKYRNKPKQQTISQALGVFATAGSIVGLGMLLFFIDTPLENYLLYFAIALLINLVIAIIVLILSFARPIRTYEGDKRRKEWQSFANMLDNIGNFNMRDIASLPLWEEFLAYAISLDVADKVIEAMNVQYNMNELVEEMHMPLVFYRNPYWINNVIRPSVNQSLQNTAPNQTGKFSGTNTGGFGGGFSGGSSGGSGGGGGTGGF